MGPHTARNCCSQSSELRNYFAGRFGAAFYEGLIALSQKLEQAFLRLLVRGYVLEDSFGFSMLCYCEGFALCGDLSENLGGMRFQVAYGFHRFAQFHTLLQNGGSSIGPKYRTLYRAASVSRFRRTSVNHVHCSGSRKALRYE